MRKLFRDRKDIEKSRTFFQIEYTTKKKGKMIEERKSKELSKLKIETICSHGHK